MSTDLYADVLYNDGEGITHGDANNARAFLGARLFDQLLARLTGNLAAAEDPDITAEGGNDPGLTSLAYTLHGGECVIAQGSSSTKVKLLPGTILQRTAAAADGAEAKMLAYTIRAGDVDLTIGAGHATLNRIDIVQMKLELVDGDSESRDFKDAVTGALSTITPDKTRRVQATFSIKAGTAAATPTYPAPDSGYVMVASVYVPDTWAANFTDDQGGYDSSSAILHQCTVPLNVEAYTVRPHEMDVSQATNWAVDAGAPGAATGYMKASGAATNLRVHCPAAGHTKRIVGIEIVASWVTSAVVELTTYHVGLLGWTKNTNGTFVLTSTLASVGAGDIGRLAHLGHIADASPASEPSAANGPIGDPIWARGGRSGPAARRIERAGGTINDATWAERAALEIDAGDTSAIYEVTFYLAG